MPHVRYSRKSLDSIVRLRLMKDMILKVDGKVTGIHYIWNRAGSEVDVDSNDAEFIRDMGKNRRSCCGSFGSPYFEEVR